MTRKKISLCYKIITVASLIIGITLNLWHRDAYAVISMLSYYTLQSNIICLVAFVFFVIKEIRGKDANDIYYLVKGAIVIAIIITAVVYRLALAPNSFEMDSLKQSINNKMLANFFVHTLSPILVFFDYILFDEKGNFKKYYPIIWLFIPLQYVFYVYTYSWRGGTFYGIGGSRKYAYSFLDYELIGYKGVFFCIGIFAIAIVAASYVLVVFDYVMGKKRESD